jgi:hypothetical protein
MQARRLRLGDVVDDYCPRERRLSNHVIVAIVDDTIKQTRCSTCDYEHPYKDGKLPARRAKKDATSALFKQVLDNVTDGVTLAEPEPPAPPPVRGVLRPNGVAANGEAPASEAGVEVSPPDTPRFPVPPAPLPIAARESANREAANEDPEDAQPRDEGPVHRTLIRATLPRIESDVPARPIPTFTVREAAAAPKFRRFRPKRGPGGGQPFGDNFGNRAGGFKNPQFGAQSGRNHNQQQQGHPNRGNQPRHSGAPGGAPGGSPGGHGGRRNNQRRNKGPR